MNKQEKAQKILFDSGFVSDYYRILDVMNGNKDSTNIRHETTTGTWARKVMRDKLKYLKRKYPNLSVEIDRATDWYFDSVRNKHEFILDRIITNSRKAAENIDKRPVIAIDVDGVLRDNLGIMVDMYNEQFGQKLTIDDVKEFKTEKSFPEIEPNTGMTSSSWFFNLHAKEIFLDAPAFDGIKEDIERLKEVADVVIVTYQKDYTNKEYTLQWLEKNGIEPNGICFLRDKTLLHCDVLVDDNDWNFIGTHVKHSVLVTAPYNKDLELGELLKQTHSIDVSRVKSFHDFVEAYLKKEIKTEG